MGDIVSLDDPTNYKFVAARIRSFLRKGFVDIRPHALKRMQERGFESTDIQHVILYGRVIDHSLPDVKGHYWRYVVQGTTPDKKLLHCVVEINNHLMIVSIYKGKLR